MKMPLPVKGLLAYVLFVYPAIRLAGYAQIYLLHQSGSLSEEAFDYLTLLAKAFGASAILAAFMLIVARSPSVRIYPLISFLLLAPLFNIAEPVIAFLTQPSLSGDPEKLKVLFAAQSVWLVLSLAWSICWILYLLKNQRVATWLSLNAAAPPQQPNT